MKFYIPHLRDRIRVTEDFTFPLHRESRNDEGVFGFEFEYGDDQRKWWPHDTIITSRTYRNGTPFVHTEHVFHPIDVTIPAGTILGVDRIFIRQGARDYDSVTFRSYGEGLPKGRFWIKLDDLNGMEMEQVNDK